MATNDAINNSLKDQTGTGKYAGDTDATHINPEIVDANGNEILLVNGVASAVNEITVSNAATSDAPIIEATGGNSNISIELKTKGTGNVGIGTNVPGEALTVAGTTVAVMAEGTGVTKAGYKVKTNGAVRWDINTPSASSGLVFKDSSSNDVLSLTQGGNVGLGTQSPGATLDVVSTDSIRFPVGTEAQRPSSPLSGMQRFNSDSNSMEVYDGTNWDVSASGLSGTNLVIGGNFSLNPWQRGTTFTAATTSTYGADRFARYSTGTVAVVTMQKTADAPTITESGVGSSDCLELDVTTIDATIGAADASGLRYTIEAYDFGAVAEQTVTLSFWVKAFTTGTYCIGFLNSAFNRSYVVEYTVDTTATWEKKTITLTLDTAGTWLTDTNGKGLNIYFMTSCGSTYQTTKDAWTAGLYFATSSQVNATASTSDYFRINLVQFEKGNTATPFEIRSRAEELALCKRYYRKSFPQGTAPATGAGYGGSIGYIAQTAGVSTWSESIWFDVQMRVKPPTVTYYNPVTANANWYNSGLPADSAAAVAFTLGDNYISLKNPQVAGDLKGNGILIHYTADAEL